MALPTLESDEYRHGLVRQPLWQLIDPVSHLLDPGTQEEFTITFNATASPTQTVALTYDGRTVTMTADPSPDDSGNEFDTAATAALQAQAFYEGCLRNYHLTRDYTISYSPGSTVVTFEAILVGAKFKPTAAVITPGSLATYSEIGVGSDATYQSNYSVGVRVWIEEEWKSDLFVPLPDLLGAPDGESGLVALDLSKMLRPYVGAYFPAYGQSGAATHAETTLRRWFFDYWESWGDTITPRATQRQGSTAAPLKAWFGGLYRADRPDAVAFMDEITDTLGDHYWLTWRGRDGNKRRASKSEPVYLGWYMHTDRLYDVVESLYEVWQLQARLVYRNTDGTNEVTTGWVTIYSDSGTGLTMGEVGLWPVGYDQLGMATYLPAGKDAVRWEVRIRGDQSGSIMSEVYTMHVAPEDHQQILLMYCNSLGMPETLRTRGGWVRGSDYSLDRWLRTPRAAGELHAAQQVAAPSGRQVKLQVNTGPLQLGELLPLLDLLVTPELRMLDTTRQRYIPVTLASGKAKEISRGDANERRYALELEILVDDNEELVSELPSAFL